MRPSRRAALGERRPDVKENPAFRASRGRARLGEQAARAQDGRRMPLDALPLVLLPSLSCDDALWSHQVRHLGRERNLTVADLRHDDSLDAMAARTLAAAPPRFALAARLAVIEECGHLSPLERPQAVTVLLRLWLEGALP
jgi:hypothetical protein